MWFVCQNPSKPRKFQPLPGHGSGLAAGLAAIFIMHCWLEDLPTPSIDIAWSAGCFWTKFQSDFIVHPASLKYLPWFPLALLGLSCQYSSCFGKLLSSPRLEPNPVPTIGRQRWRWRGRIHGVKGDATFQWNPSWHQKLQLAHTSTAGKGQADPPQDSKNNSQHFKTKKHPWVLVLRSQMPDCTKLLQEEKEEAVFSSCC